MFANLFDVGFSRCNFSGAGRLQQAAHFLVQVSGQAQQLLLALTAFGLEHFPLPGLGQAVAIAAEQLGRAAEKAAAGENFLQGLVGLVHAAILEPACAQVLLFDLILSQQQLSAKAGLLQ